MATAIRLKESVVKTPGVCGGDACISGTRIPVWLLEFERRLGMTEVQLLQRHPSVSLESLCEAFSYAESNRNEIERQIAKNEG